LEKSVSNKSVTFLDAGGYDGRLTFLAFKHLTRKGFKVFAVVLDLSLDAGKRINKNLNYVCGDINNLPFKLESFDIVCSYSVFEHLHTPQVASKELASVSKGPCVIQIPNMKYFVELHTKAPLLYMFPHFARKRIIQITGVPYLLNFNVHPASLTFYFQQAAFSLITVSQIYHAKWTKLLRTPQGDILQFERMNPARKNI